MKNTTFYKFQNLFNKNLAVPVIPNIRNASLYTFNPFAYIPEGFIPLNGIPIFVDQGQFGIYTFFLF